MSSAEEIRKIHRRGPDTSAFRALETPNPTLSTSPRSSSRMGSKDPKSMLHRVLSTLRTRQATALGKALLVKSVMLRTIME